MAVDAGYGDALFCKADMLFHGSDGYEVVVLPNYIVDVLFQKNYPKALDYYQRAARAGVVDAFICEGRE
jgi:TPR repeat protein